MKIEFDQKNIKWGLTAFIVILCSIIVFFSIFRFEALQKIIGICTRILAPFIYGLVMAYLLCPIYNFIVRKSYQGINKVKPGLSKSLTISKGAGSIVALATIFVVIGGMIWMILPGLMDSIIKIIEILPSSMEGLKVWVDEKLTAYPDIDLMLHSWINAFTDNVVIYFKETIFPEYAAIATSISEGLIEALNIIKNFFIAIIICVYFLNSKDTFSAQSKKVILATFKPDRAEKILEGANFTNKTFGGFINGKIIDSIIVGFICFTVMMIFDWEYALLISCIIGITNIIPFFGPFIGAIPSALLLLMVDHRQCISFLIFILILQQFDGNILGPKILGETTGISSFWVLFAVLVGGGLFGFVGMVIGIPIFAIIYTYVSKGLNNKLGGRGYSTSIADYKVDVYRTSRRKKKKKTKDNDK